MMEIFSSIFFIADTDSVTALPLSSISLAPLRAICAMTRLLSEFCVIEAFICSRLEVVSSTEAACSEVLSDNKLAAADTWVDAEETRLAVDLTRWTRPRNPSIIWPKADSILPISSSRVRANEPVKSPAAIAWATFTRLSIGAETHFRIIKKTPAPDRARVIKVKTRKVVEILARAD